MSRVKEYISKKLITSHKKRASGGFVWNDKLRNHKAEKSFLMISFDVDV